MNRPLFSFVFAVIGGSARQHSRRASDRFCLAGDWGSFVVHGSSWVEYVWERGATFVGLP